jgi:hypothetical protein
MHNAQPPATGWWARVNLELLAVMLPYGPSGQSRVAAPPTAKITPRACPKWPRAAHAGDERHMGRHLASHPPTGQQVCPPHSPLAGARHLPSRLEHGRDRRVPESQGPGHHLHALSDSALVAAERGESERRESNPRSQLGKLMYCLCTTLAGVLLPSMLAGCHRPLGTGADGTPNSRFEHSERQCTWCERRLRQAR